LEVESAIFSNYFIHFFKTCHKNTTLFFIAVIRLCDMSKPD